MRSRNRIQYFRFAVALGLARITKRRIPLIAVLCVTNKCNLKCWYCYGEHPYRLDRPEFTTAELLGLIRGLHALGTRILQLQGGEPLLRDDLKAVIEEAKRLGMVCDMVTNGTLIAQRPQLIRLLDKICISLDGPLETNDRNRGRGAFESAVEGIRLASGAGLPVRISAVLTSESTTADVSWLIAFAREHGISVNFCPPFEFVPRFQPEKCRPHMVPDEQLKGIFQYLVECKHNGDPVQFTADSYLLAAQWPFTYQKRRVFSHELPGHFSHPRCYHGDYVIFIDSDGSVYPCCNSWGGAAKNIRRDGLEDAVKGLSRRGCEACYVPAYIDRNLFFDGRPNVWRNYLSQV